MPIIAKNIIVGKQEEQKIVPPENKFVNVFDKLREQEKKVSTVINQKVETKVEKSSEQDHYKHVHHGDLHKLYNTKSEYLRDMAVLENL